MTAIAVYFHMQTVKPPSNQAPRDGAWAVTGRDAKTQPTKRTGGRFYRFRAFDGFELQKSGVRTPGFCHETV